MPPPQAVSGKSLAEWLAILETRHPQNIELGLERVGQVRDRLGLQPDAPILTVGGTNGKGSTVAYLEAMLEAAGYRTGAYTSPHLIRFNERIRLNACEADDTAIVAALDAVEAVRGDVSLTYFEHTTLAAVWLFQQAKVDAILLEVGLGGRLDAVNLFDADVAIVTSIDFDHMDYLGADRESIGFEKAGIFRAGHPALCGDPNPPRSLLEHAYSIGAYLLQLNQEIHISETLSGWNCRLSYRGDRQEDAHFSSLPFPAMPGRYQRDNAAMALAALWSVRNRLPITLQAMRSGLARARVSGRFQVLNTSPFRLVDVAHNPHAARALAGNLANLPEPGIKHAVLGMFADKDCAGVINALKDQIDVWHVATLPPPRGATARHLAQCLADQGLRSTEHPDVLSAWNAACQEAGPADTIAAFGSFHTVADILSSLRTHV